MSQPLQGRGWRFPFAVDPASGAVATSGEHANIQQSITVILGTRPGERPMLPEFGCRLQELLFAPLTDATASLAGHHVRDALSRWEPRIEVTEVHTTPEARGALRVVVHYRIRSTSELAQLDLVITG